MVFRRLLDVFNSGAMALSDAPVVGRVVGRYITPITYRGRAEVVLELAHPE